MSHGAFKEITHFTVIEMPEPIYSLPPWWPSEEIVVVEKAESERSSIYPAGFLPSAPSEASTTDVASLSNVSVKEEDSNNSVESSHSFAFSPSMTLPSTIQFPVTPTPFPSSLYVNCPSLTSPRKRKFSEFFKGKL
uniref:Uncharacterized protein n=1 Tax=Panagrolaimus sp. ES5 TaxID=591445 RepID=A0AC34GP11_9BILA